MKVIKRLELAALLSLCVAFSASTHLQARPPKDKDSAGAIELANVGDEPRTLGEMALADVRHLGSESAPWFYIAQNFTANLTVTCSKLKPGATYWTPAGTFTADAKGQGTVTGPVQFQLVYYQDQWGSCLSEPYVVEVIRLDTDGSRSTVLEGQWGPPFLVSWW